MYEYPVQNDEETGVGSYSGALETGVLFLDAHGYCHCVNHSAKSFINHLTGGEYSKYLVKESNAAGFNLIIIFARRIRTIFKNTWRSVAAAMIRLKQS